MVVVAHVSLVHPLMQIRSNALGVMMSAVVGMGSGTY